MHRISYIIHYKKVNGARIPNGKSSLLGHVFSQRLDNAEVFRTLPLKSADIKIRVLISSAYTSEQRRATLKPYEIRKERVYALFLWFKTHHPSLYGTIGLDADALNALPVNGYIPDLIETTEIVSVSATDSAAAAQSAVSSPVMVAVPVLVPAPINSMQSAGVSMSDGAGGVESAALSAAAPASAPVAAGSDQLDNAITMSQSILVPRPNLTYRSTAVRLRMLISDTKTNGKKSAVLA